MAFQQPSREGLRSKHCQEPVGRYLGLLGRVQSSDGWAQSTPKRNEINHLRTGTRVAKLCRCDHPKVVVPSRSPLKYCAFLSSPRSETRNSPPEKDPMYPVFRSLTCFACFGLVSLMAAAQGTTCAADGENPQGSPIACVTGQGVEIKAAAAPVASQGPEVLPLSPEQRPATQPFVIFDKGMLTIIANNAMLGDILRAVGQKTGADIDIPGEASERVVSQLGPGKPRDVIASLLNGSHFNYVMVGSEIDTNAVSRVVLTAKGDHGTGASAAPNGASNVAGNYASRGMVQPRTALQQAVMQPYQELLQQQQAQQIQTPDFQQQPISSTSENPAPATQASTAGESNVSNPIAAGPTGTETAAVDQPASGDAQKATGDRTPQQMLQDLYETRRQMMAKQQPQQTQQPQPPQ